MLSLPKLPDTLVNNIVMVAAVTMCVCFVIITAGFVGYLIVHDGATPALVFDALKTIATTLLMSLTALVSVPHLAAAFVASAQAKAGTAAQHPPA